MNSLFNILTILLFIFYVLPNNFINCDKDLYKILELKRTCTPAEIKKQYRKLTLKYHPDRNRDNPKAKEMFTDVAEANEILSDPKLRRIYDRGGMDQVKSHIEQKNQGGGGGFDPFGGMFGSFFGGNEGGEKRDEDVRIKLRTSLYDLYVGREVEYTYTRNIVCPHCRGSGAESPDDVKECDKCKGKGHILQRQEIAPGFVQQFQQQCPKCGGKGKVTSKACHACKGDKIIKGLEELNVYIEKGMPNGHEIKFDELGEERPDMLPGNLIFVINELKHDLFRREKNDLHLTFDISLKDALLGFEKQIEHLDKHKVLIKKDVVTQPGEVMRIKNEGMPVHESSGEFGDLFVKFNIVFPDHLTEKQILIAKKLFLKRNFW